MEDRETISRSIYRCITLIMIGYTFLTLIRWIAKTCIISIRSDLWGITEFLINYQGGYVRRGLMGEILYHISQIFPSIDSRYYIVSICVISFCVFVWFLISHFRANSLCWWFLPLNICVLGADFIRKDFISCVFIMLILALYTKINSQWLRVLACSVCLILALNIHECIFFMIVPFIILLYVRDTGYHFFHRLIGISAPIVCMSIVCSYKGDKQIAQSIWNSWGFMYNSFSFISPKCSIEAIGWETLETIEYHIRSNFMTQFGIIYGWYSKPLIWILILFTLPNILFIKRNWKNNKSAPDITRMLSIMIFQFLSLLPMFTVLSCDGCRICFYWTVSSLLIYFCIPHSVYLRIAPQILTKTASFLQKTIFFRKSYIVSIVLMLFICITPYGTSRASLMHSVIGTYAQTCYLSLKFAGIIPKDIQFPILDIPMKKIKVSYCER